MYRLSHFSEALKHFDSVLNLSGGHLLAQEYKAKAQSSMGQDVPLGQAGIINNNDDKSTVTLANGSNILDNGKISKKSSMPGWVWAIIGAWIVLIAFVIVLLVIMLGKKNKSPQTGIRSMYYQQPLQQQSTNPVIPQEKPDETKSKNDRKINFCPKCGSRIEEGHTFCPNCGNKVK
jgi:hypothetical protein